MQEKHITIGDVTYALPKPFMVMATQNPVDQEGTYALPEAQVDRFMMKIKITYPKKDEEKIILDRMMDNADIPLNCIVSKEKITQLNNLVNEIYIGDRVKNYIVDIIDATRHPENYGLKINNLINYPASPRASIFLARAAKGFALINGRGYVTADDIKNVSMMVLRHRILLSYEAEAEGISSEDVITKIFNSVVVP
jgi:MoxR-like ATPase